jgi:hypothetical protein
VREQCIELAELPAEVGDLLVADRRAGLGGAARGELVGPVVAPVILNTLTVEEVEVALLNIKNPRSVVVVESSKLPTNAL